MAKAVEDNDAAVAESRSGDTIIKHLETTNLDLHATVSVLKTKLKRMATPTQTPTPPPTGPDAAAVLKSFVQTKVLIQQNDEDLL